MRDAGPNGRGKRREGLTCSINSNERHQAGRMWKKNRFYFLSQCFNTKAGTPPVHPHAGFSTDSSLMKGTSSFASISRGGATCVAMNNTKDCLLFHKGKEGFSRHLSPASAYRGFCRFFALDYGLKIFDINYLGRFLGFHISDLR